MEEYRERQWPVWILPQLWGLDVPIAVLLWSLVCAAHMQIIMMSEGPLLLVAVTVWVFTIFSRVHNAVRYKSGWYHGYYESHAVPMLLVAAAAAMAALWMCLYYVGRHVLEYAMVPAVFLALGCLLGNMRLRFLSALCKALALGFACMVPAFSLSFMLVPLQMLFCAPCWYMGILFFLFMREKEQWRHDEDGSHGVSGLLVAGLFLLLVVNVLAAVTAQGADERSLSITLVTASACLMVLTKIRADFNNHVLFASSWAVMALPPLLGLLLFYPDYWEGPWY